MGWTSTRTSRGTLHVVNSEDGSHFEAADEEEAQTNIDAIRQAQEEARRAVEEAEAEPDRLSPVGDVKQPDTSREN